MGSTPPPPSALRFSQPLDGLHPSTLYGLVSSRSHVQASPFRVFPSPGAVSTRRRAAALLWLPWVTLLFRGELTRSSASGPCSPGESVVLRPHLSRPNTRFPLGLSPLQGLLRFGRCSCFHEHPLTSLAFPTYGTWEALLPRVFPGPKDGPSLARGSAFLRFLAFS